ncbi:calnexin-like [Brevipalpus obovatus]|uniref:calnexin-like n=1 Tax=Brevipalpus obovatus TaxID=246614 RepID=UPI003D9F94B0
MFGQRGTTGSTPVNMGSFSRLIWCLLLILVCTTLTSRFVSTQSNDDGDGGDDNSNFDTNYADGDGDDDGGDDEIASVDTSQPSKKSERLIDYKTPDVNSQETVHLYEPFDDDANYKKNWILSKATKAESSDNKYDGQWTRVTTDDRIKGDYGLMMSNKARHHAIGAKLKKPFKFDGGNLVVQYDVQFRNGQECGGAYLKLLASPSGDLSKVHDKSPYSIMFGPDKCGNDHKLHFIFNHKNAKTGTTREIHWKKAASASGLSEAITDGKWHLFRLVVRPDNSFEVNMDRKVVGKGNLLDDFDPPVNPPKEIDDPNDKKPADWDEREKIPDPDAKKPDDWDESEPRKIPDENAKKPSDWLEDEPETIPDPQAKKPDDWSEDMDGEWEAPLINNPKCSEASGCGEWKAPLIDNPKYKGKWKPPLISNPNFKGKWAPRKIPNPEYSEDLTPYKMLTIDAAAFELWTISDGIVFDNVLVTTSVDLANMVADNTYLLKKDIGDEKGENWFQSFVRSTNKQPWLWVVYVLAIVVPTILLIIRMSKGTKKDEEKAGPSRVGGDETEVDEFDKPGPSGQSHQTFETKKGSSDDDIVGAETEEEELEEDQNERGDSAASAEEEVVPEEVEESKDSKMKTRSRRARRE